MSEYNPNENRFDSEPPKTNENTGWSSQSNNAGDAYRQPQYTQQQPQRPPEPPRQYSPSGGWQQPSGDAPTPPYQWNMNDYATAGAARPKRRKKGLVVFSVILGAVLVVSLVSFAGVGLYNTFTRAPEAPGPSNGPTVNVPATDLPSLALQDKPEGNTQPLPGGRMTTEQIVEQVSPSIVAITTYADGGYGYQAEGMGSGIIIREDGYIVTNAHVVEGSKGITVTLHDGETKYEGRIVGSDSKTDLAVIRVDATGLAAATFGNSEQTKVGEKVIAIGNPQSMDFAGSVTQGIVSGLNRTLTASGGASGTTTYSSLIQTDAAINPGNSGGALVNEFGQIIGINSAKVVSTGAEGMGFAIPAATAKPIVDDLIAHGRVTGRVMLGIVASPVDEVLGRLNGWPTGLLVQSTQADSDISKKGVIPGDIITKADENPLDGIQSLQKALEGKQPGDTVGLEIYRPSSRRGESGRFFTVRVQLLEDMGDSSAAVAPDVSQPVPEYTPPAPENYEQNPGYDEYDFFREFFR